MYEGREEQERWFTLYRTTLRLSCGLTVHWAGAESGLESKKVAGRAGRGEREAHIFLAHGSILCEKGGSTFAWVVITAHRAFCNFTCWSCAAEVPMNKNWGCVKCPDFSNACVRGFAQTYAQTLTGIGLTTVVPMLSEICRGQEISHL